ncbi:hypothetical protein CALVIDRAFT_535517 [Calocera viscosa TUFC12733]|uniref:Uncharacterized protein n=1 Tax=Calocera viscosa (strain TUFC12733) TaxID=1330018 RepID=A0A167P4W2_CALVF|nr:hypothetical protein CALVIDRAFT_535517 [Calocera viscosa TUFC12733]
MHFSACGAERVLLRAELTHPGRPPSLLFCTITINKALNGLSALLGLIDAQHRMISPLLLLASIVSWIPGFQARQRIKGLAARRWHAAPHNLHLRRLSHSTFYVINQGSTRTLAPIFV